MPHRNFGSKAQTHLLGFITSNSSILRHVDVESTCFLSSFGWHNKVRVERLNKHLVLSFLWFN